MYTHKLTDIVTPVIVIRDIVRHTMHIDKYAGYRLMQEYKRRCSWTTVFRILEKYVSIFICKYFTFYFKAQIIYIYIYIKFSLNSFIIAKSYV